jgi:hypothetical protein
VEDDTVSAIKVSMGQNGKIVVVGFLIPSIAPTHVVVKGSVEAAYGGALVDANPGEQQAVGGVENCGGVSGKDCGRRDKRLTGAKLVCPLRLGGGRRL